MEANLVIYDFEDLNFGLLGHSTFYNILKATASSKDLSIGTVKPSTKPFIRSEPDVWKIRKVRNYVYVAVWYPCMIKS